jgi:hypothetical protein
MSNTTNRGAVVLLSPNSMSFRAITNSSVLELVKHSVDSGVYSHIFVLSSNPADKSVLPEYVEWRSIYKPSSGARSSSFVKQISRAISVRLSRWCGLGFANIAYRFNHIQGFYAHKFKRQMNAKRRQREILAGNYVSRRFGFPFANSHRLYRLCYSFFYSTHQVSDPRIEDFFEEIKIEKLVFWHTQNEIYRDYSVCARKRKISYVGVIGSWDRPTTKGPICPGCKKLIVNNQIMKQELVRYHGYEEDIIDVVGWPQMDSYFDRSLRQERKHFLKSIGVPVDHKVILFAGNSERLGAHEPGVVEYIADQILVGKYGNSVQLLIRPHPQDPRWAARYQKAAEFSCVTLMPAQMGALEMMINSILHADIVVATQGSITIDAAAFDKPIINIGFDGYLTRAYNESVKRWYDLDHYRPIVESGGVALAESFESLDTMINEQLSGQDQYIEGRERLRKIELEPFDGDSSNRQVIAMLGLSSGETLPGPVAS